MFKISRLYKWSDEEFGREFEKLMEEQKFVTLLDAKKIMEKIENKEKNDAN